jgi:hypothetical protein
MIRLSANGRPGAGLVIAAAVMAVGAVAGRWIRRSGVVSFPYGRAQSANLEARRGEPSVWLVAHLDSKSQTVPMLARIASSVALQMVSVLILGATFLSILGLRLESRFWTAMSIVMVASALPIILCFVGNKSPGAVDNASGVVAILLAAQSAAAPRDLGVLITSAEELGLAGARVWAPSAPSTIRVLNCDTVDDRGSWRCMYSGPKPDPITAAAESAGRASALSIRFGRLIPGILADNVAFADARIRAVTISRGNFSTLARIHTWRDNSTGMTGQGAALASVFLSALAKELT